MATTDESPRSALSTADATFPFGKPAPLTLVVGVEDLLTDTRHELRSKINAAIDNGLRDLVIDATRCQRLDSAAIGMLVTATKRCRDLGGSLVITGLIDDLRAAFALSKIDQVLTIR